MKCTNCGSRLSESSNFCKKCGEPVVTKEELKKIELTDNIDISQINMAAEEKERELDQTIILPEIIDLIKTPEKDKVDLSEDSIESEILKVAEGEEETKPSKKEKKTSKKEDKKSKKDSKKSKKEENEIVNESTSSADIVIEDEVDKEFVELITEEPVITTSEKVDDNNSKISLEDYMKNAKTEDLSKTTSIAYNMENNNSDIFNLEEPSTKDIILDILSRDEKTTVNESVKEEEKKEEVKEEKRIEVKETQKKEETIKVEQVIVRKNNPVIVFLLIAAIIALVGVSIYALGNKDNKKEKVKEEPKTEEKKEESKKEDKYVIFKGYKIIINDFRNYNLTQNDLILYSEDYTIHTNIEFNVKFDDIKKSKDSYKEKLINDGYKVNSYGKKVQDGREYLVYEISKSDKKTLLVYSSLNDGNTVNFLIDSVNYDSLTITNSIIDNSKKEMSYTSYDDDFYIRNNE